MICRVATYFVFAALSDSVSCVLSPSLAQKCTALVDCALHSVFASLFCARSPLAVMLTLHHLQPNHNCVPVLEPTLAPHKSLATKFDGKSLVSFSWLSTAGAIPDKMRTCRRLARVDVV